MEKRSRYDSLEFGTLIGLIIPIITLVIFYIFQKGTLEGLQGYLSQLIMKDIFTKVISLCAIPNLLFFFVFINKKFDLSAKGVILATLLLTIIVVFMKF